MEPVRPTDFSSATPPEESVALSAVVVSLRTALGAVPVLGTAASEGLGALVAWDANRKTQTWMQVLEDRLNHLDARAVNLESREKAEEIVDMALAATLAAAKTHNDEKLRMLQNAVLNTTAAGAAGADERMVFLRFVDELTPTHIRILSALPPLAESSEFGRFGTVEQIHQEVSRLCPELDLEAEAFDVFFMELQSRGLIHYGMGQTGTLRYNASNPLVFPPMSQRFLRFIGDPEGCRG